MYKFTVGLFHIIHITICRLFVFVLFMLTLLNNVRFILSLNTIKTNNATEIEIRHINHCKQIVSNWWKNFGVEIMKLIHYKG